MVRPNNRQKVVFETSSYRRDLKRCVRRGWNLKHLKSIVDGLQEGKMPPDRCKSHRLSGFPWDRSWERHVKSDWLLIWDWSNAGDELILVRTGTHSDLFK